MQEIVKLDISQKLYIIINSIITCKALFVSSAKLSNFVQIKLLTCLRVKKLSLRYKNKRMCVYNRSGF